MITAPSAIPDGPLAAFQFSIPYCEPGATGAEYYADTEARPTPVNRESSQG